MTALTQEEKAKIINIIGLKFIKIEDKIDVALTEDTTLITPYTYHDLAMMLIARLNTLTNQEKFRLRKTLNSKIPEKLKIIHILQIGKYFKYH